MQSKVSPPPPPPPSPPLTTTSTRNLPSDVFSKRSLLLAEDCDEVHVQGMVFHTKVMDYSFEGKTNKKKTLENKMDAE